MNKKYQDEVDRLEKRVAELTQALEKTEKREKSADLMLELSQQLNNVFALSLDLNNLTARLSEIIQSAFTDNTVSIFLADPTQQWVISYPILNNEPPQYSSVKDNPVIGQVVRTGKLVQTSSIEKKPKKNGHQQSINISRVALPLIPIGEAKTAGVLTIEHASDSTFDKSDIKNLQQFTPAIASALVKSQNYHDVISERDKASLLYEINTVLATAFDFETILKAAISFADRLGAKTGSLYLIAESGNVYFHSTNSKLNSLNNADTYFLVHQTLSEGLASWVLETEQSVLITDTLADERWLPSETIDPDGDTRSIICSPIIIERGRIRGSILFTHSHQNYFKPQDQNLLDTLVSQIAVALENTILFTDLQNNLHQTQLIINTSQQLVKATNLQKVYQALAGGIMSTGADRCELHICEDLDINNIPKYSEVVFTSDITPELDQADIGFRFSIAQYPTLEGLARTQEALVINDLSSHDALTEAELQFLTKFGATSLTIIPLIARRRVIGLLFIEFRLLHHFDDQELTLYHTLCNQAIATIESTRQQQQTEIALAETQTLYRAGRVLAGATNLADILEESLFEFLYSLGLDQGGIIFLSSDRAKGELVAYVQGGQQQQFERLTFDIDESIPYQQMLLAGRPFTSYDVENDPRMKGYVNFNPDQPIKSLLQAPMIVGGVTVGWIGADSVKKNREFLQREIDLARAMADQIAITIQNRRLLEKGEKQAEQFKVVAQVGQAVSQMMEIDQILTSTVNLIRDRFGFYHVSIFLLDDSRQWAVVRASTGEVGKIMVERPHRLEVGGQSIVGYATGQAKARIAHDVGEDAVHFDNPLLPNTRSEMALPIVSKGEVIGALDVQSVQANAFDDDAIETLQVLVDQLTVALENARLFLQTQQNEIFLKAIIDQIPDPIFIKDQQHRWIVVNTAFTQGILGRSEEEIIGFSDYDFLPKEEADHFWAEDDKVFETGNIQETEETITNYEGEQRYLYTRKIPLEFSDDGIPVKYLIGIINDITERKQQEVEREQLIGQISVSLQRTQSLYRVSHALTTASDPQAAFETVLGEHLRLLKLNQGSLMLLDTRHNEVKARARYIKGKPVTPHFRMAVEDDLVFQHLRQTRAPLVINNVQNHPLIKRGSDKRGLKRVQSMLFIPLIIGRKVIGSLVSDATDPNHKFSKDDIEVGETIAGQLSVRLEGWQLLKEAQHKSDLLETAADISRAASIILDVDQLINTAVNLIRDKFEVIYYVGLFLIDDARKWAVLRAGTGEAGRLQIEAGHRLPVGGGSMIGWSVQNQKPRIDLDVGGDAEHFKRNKYLPDTRSELALPLISGQMAIGALTVQSTQRNAFTTEDISLLQTLADQLANAIAIAGLFENIARTQQEAEARLKETVALQEFSQSLSTTLQATDILDLFFQVCLQSLGFEYVIFSTLNKQGWVQAVAGRGVSDSLLDQTRYTINEDNFVAEILRTGKTKVITGWVEGLNRELFESEMQSEWIRLFTPITLLQRHVGLVEVGYKSKHAAISPAQQRMLQAFIDQAVLALDNAQRYEASQRTAQREAIIREITGKIRTAVDVNDILQTTINELSLVLGANRGSIKLAPSDALADPASSPTISGNRSFED